MFSRSSFQYARRANTDSQAHLRPKISSSPELKLTSKDSLPKSFEGCMREIGRIVELQQSHAKEIATLADRHRALMSKMQGMTPKSRPVSEVEPEKNYLKPVDYTKIVPPRISKVYPGDAAMYSSVEELDGQRSSETYRRISARKSDRADQNGNFQWDNIRFQSTFCEDTFSSPLITTLKKLKWQYRDFQHIRRWCKALTKLFYETDEDGSGSIEEDEFRKMIDKLPINDMLKENLRGQFKEIDLDNSGGISLAEFLFFFLQYKPFRVELNDNLYNEPYLGQHNLSCLRRSRLLVFKTITVTDYNMFSKMLYFVDLIFTLIPLVILFIYAVSPTMENILHWDEDTYFWFVSIFFAVQWVLGLALCHSKTTYIKSHYHIMELVSFLPWIIFKGSGYTGSTVKVKSFVLFRLMRAFQLTHIFPSTFTSLKEQIDIYENTLILAYTSYRAMAVFMLFINLFLSTLIFAFERGEYIEDLNGWIRPGESEESPFSNYFNCFYFTIVTGTTLGYGDMSPVTYIGKLIALIIVAIGLINITFIINTIGDCFEEVFRRFLVERTTQIEDERADFIRQNVDQAKRKIEHLNRKRTRVGAVEMLQTKPTRL